MFHLFTLQIVIFRLFILSERGENKQFLFGLHNSLVFMFVMMMD